MKMTKRNTQREEEKLSSLISLSDEIKLKKATIKVLSDMIAEALQRELDRYHRKIKPSSGIKVEIVTVKL